MNRLHTFFIVFISGLLSCNSDTVLELHQKYMKASINHDLETLSSMTAEDAVWKLGPYNLTGKKAVLGPNFYDAGLENKLEYKDVNVKGDTVEFKLLEINDIFIAVGMREVRRFPRFIFKAGLLKKKEPWKPSTDMTEVMRRQIPLRKWIRENHPAAIEQFLDSNGDFIFSKENGVLMRKLALEWQGEKESITNKP